MTKTRGSHEARIWIPQLENILTLETQKPSLTNKTRVQKSQDANLLNMRSIHRREGRIDKLEKLQNHQTRVLLINTKSVYKSNER